MIAVLVTALRARRCPAACVWLAALLVLPAAARAERQLPPPAQANPPPLDLVQPSSDGLPAPAATSPSATPAPAAARAAKPPSGLVTIDSDVQRADQTTGVVTSSGNVRIVYPDQRVVATARQAQYFSKEGRVVLSGDVDLVQEGGNLLRAEQVVYQLKGQRLLAIPAAGQQVFTRVRLLSPSSPAAAPASSR